MIPEIEAEYIREMRQNYLVIAMEEVREQGFEARMMIGNTIGGLLKFRIKKTDNQSRFCYEITSKQPLSRLLETKTINAVQIRGLLLGITRTLTRMEDYLLTEDQILLDPDYIYVDPDEYEPYLCLIPGRHGDFPMEFSRFLQYLLEKADHKDQEAVVLIYGLYRESLKENYGLDNLLRWLMKENCPEMESPGKGEDCEKIITEKTKPQEGSTKAGQQKSPTVGQIPRVSSCLLPGIGLLVLAGISGLLLGRQGFLSYGLWLMLAGLLLCAGGMAFWVWSLYGRSNRTLFYGQTPQEPTFNQQKQNSQLSYNQTSFSEQSVNQEDQTNPANFEFSQQFYDPGKSTQAPNAPGQWRMIFEEEEPEAVSKPEEPHGQEMRTELLWNAETVKETHSLVNEDGTEILLSYYPFIIGKQEGLCDYVIAKSTVSRLHLRVDETEEGYRITDLNSTNGTFLNGRCLSANETVSIQTGDEIGIADLKFRFK